MLDMRDLVVGDSQPAEPVIFIGSSPERGIPSPQAAPFVIFLPIRERSVDCGSELLRQGVGNGIDLRRGLTALPGSRRFQQLREGVNELVKSFVQERVCY